MTEDIATTTVALNRLRQEVTTLTNLVLKSAGATNRAAKLEIENAQQKLEIASLELQIEALIGELADAHQRIVAP